jgi:outer membrane protein OmpA-like peptidoglycan-associated protein
MFSDESSSIEIVTKNPPASPKHRGEARQNLLAKILVGGLVLSGVSLVPQFTTQMPEASASVPADSISLYLSAPMVQGPTVTGSNVFMETFDDVYTATANRLICPSSSTVYSRIEQSTDGTSDQGYGDWESCGVYNPYKHHWGGASTITSTPTFDLSPQDTMTPYAHVRGNGSFTLTLTRSARYVGFWWTAGEAGNRVKFFDRNDELIASFDTTEIVDKLEEQSGFPNGDGTTYLKEYYLGHPSGHTSATPSSNSVKPGHIGGTSTWDHWGLYTYLNLYVGGSIEVAKVAFEGGGSGFEFDNLTISTDAQTPASSMGAISTKRSSAPLVISRGGSNLTPVSEAQADPCTAASSSENVTKKSKSFPGFAINSAVLTKAMKKQIRTWLRKHPKEVCVSVAGFTMGPRVLSTDPKLAKDRARAVRAYIKSLRPEASFTKITSRTQRLVGDDVRRAKVTLRY